MTSIPGLLTEIQAGDRRALARAITLVENDLDGAAELLSSLNMNNPAPLMGITGPPGAGKSTLINALLAELSKQGKKVAVIAVDPTSPFNFGSLLGDRLRMAEHFTNENIFIRSLATRGSLGGLTEKAVEVSDVVRTAGFDYVIIETVGVGQSEVEIAGLADVTILVLVPESGDEVQTMKSGIMEIADIFVVNKADRPGANIFIRNLQQLLHHHKGNGVLPPSLVKTIATKSEGISELIEKAGLHLRASSQYERRNFLLTEKAFRLIRAARMKDVDRSQLKNRIEQESAAGNFHLYRFVQGYR